MTDHVRQKNILVTAAGQGSRRTAALASVTEGARGLATDIQGGSTITVSSVESGIRDVPRQCADGASKAAVIGLTDAFAVDPEPPRDCSRPQLRRGWSHADDLGRAKPELPQ